MRTGYCYSITLGGIAGRVLPDTMPVAEVRRIAQEVSALWIVSGKRVTAYHQGRNLGVYVDGQLR